LSAAKGVIKYEEKWLPFIPSPQSQAQTAGDVLLQSVDLAVEAERLGVDGAYFRVHHFAWQLASPFPLLAAVGARTKKVEIGTGVIDMRRIRREMHPLLNRRVFCYRCFSNRGDFSSPMDRVEKSVFLSYRRTNTPWALAIFQNLTQHGFDVFFDYNGIASGDFERVILGNIISRAHFLVLLTPSALERCNDSDDWLRREIETALSNQRNVVPLMLESFDFATPSLANQLTGGLAGLRNYNGLRIPPDYFDAAMERLRTKYLNVPLTAVLHPASASAQQAAYEQKAAANAAPSVQETELTAQQWFERGMAATIAEEKLRAYTEAIRLYPDYADAFRNRGIVLHGMNDLDGALENYNQAIRLNARDFHAYQNRGIIRRKKGDVAGADQDYDKAVRLKVDLAKPLLKKGIESRRSALFEKALREFNEAIRLNPDYAEAYFNHGKTRREMGDNEKALRDYNEAIRLKPDFVDAFYSRAQVLEDMSLCKAALADYQRFMELGGAELYGNQAKLERTIRYLREKL
jgi:tetratricopeptide (TPR) repeat protein